ncbi:C-C motif chemokine 23-like [Elephas maximus indicus]|uniref:C-C motif chemokine 23-like n=1 Tax=Elephas maximus indicus TaxID=99487 RepID=UPI002115D9A0|nr:C-C motif chemokine 23-like [Elephas maximus indicus]
MKVSTAALSFLILAFAFGSQGQLIQDTELRKPILTDLRDRLHTHQGFHRPSDCCVTYTTRNIRCVFMDHYFETSSGCSQPGVIFVTKKGQRVCANPLSKHVQDCMNNLKLDLLHKEAGKTALA